VSSPQLRAPAAVTLASCLATDIGHPLAADVCSGGAVTLTSNAPAPFPLGSTAVTWTAQDAGGHTASATETVTVVDTTAPVFTFVPPDITMNDCGPANLGLPVATDDCGGAPVLASNAPAIFLVGATPVTWTATDLSGNHGTATQVVTVHDTVPPQLACVPGTNPAGHGGGGGGFFQVVASDHCGAPTVRLGSYQLAPGETVKITENGKSGVTLVNDMGPLRVRNFQVGRGQAVLTASDGSGNTASATCR
jgi:hypothetical protein